MTPPTRSFVVGLVVAWFLSVVLAVGSRPVPFRTRKLSPPAPMVLHSGGCGRVGRRRHEYFLFVGRGCSPLLLWGGGCGPLLFYPQVNNIQSIDVVAYVSVIAIDFAWLWVFGRGPVRSRPVAEAPRILALSLLVCAIHLLHFCDYHRHLSLHTDTSVQLRLYYQAVQIERHTLT